MNQDLLREHLLSKYIHARNTNPHYSKRAFAKRVGISHGSLIEIISGKRKVSRKMALRLCEKICLNPKQTDMIFNEVFANKDDVELELREDQFELISDWSHFALLNLLKLKNETHSVENFANRLNLSITHLQKILERLIRLKLIEKSKSRYVRTNSSIKTTDEIQSVSIKIAHKKMLESSAKSVDEVSIDRRDITSVIMPINLKKLNVAKKLIRQFHDKMEALLEDDFANEVYALNIQLIPLTKSGEKK